MNTKRNTVSVPSNLAAFSGSYQKNVATAVDDTCCCILCGKNAGKGGLFVYLTSGGEYSTMEEAAEYEKVIEGLGGCLDDLGLYPVGSDCAKKLKLAGVKLYKEGDL